MSAADVPVKAITPADLEHLARDINKEIQAVEHGFQTVAQTPSGRLSMRAVLAKGSFTQRRSSASE
jgi:hypothetical protein